MSSILVVSAATIATIICVVQLQQFLRNWSDTKGSGFKVVLMPINVLSIPWLLAGKVIIPIIESFLPQRIIDDFLPLIIMERMWPAGHGPFAAQKSDTFIACSPGGNVLYTCDPDFVVTFLRNPVFTKPLHLMGLLNLFGPTISSTEGPESRLVRKATAPFFNDNINSKVFSETIRATPALTEALQCEDVNAGRDLRPLLGKLAFRVMALIGFEYDLSRDPLKVKDSPPKGHELSLSDAMLGIDHELPLIAMTPSFILANSPMESHKRRKQVFYEYRKYLEEFNLQKRNNLQPHIPENEKSVLELIVQASQNQENKSSPHLSQEIVMGNLFMFMFAGHENNGHAVQFAMHILACRPDIQSAMQKDIDRVFGDASPSTWSYEKHWKPLSRSMVAAVVHESLRVYSVIPTYVKQTLSEPVKVTVNEKNYIIPRNTFILMNTSAIHRNPKYWTSASPEAYQGKPYAPSDFNPFQWIKDNTFHSPAPGSFVPFSDGGRGCPGTRFAMVEVCAILSRIFHEFSIELAVPDVKEKDNEESKKQKWKEAKRKAEHELSAGVYFNISLNLSNDVPVKLVRRGEERFRYI